MGLKIQDLFAFLSLPLSPNLPILKSNHIWVFHAIDLILIITLPLYGHASK